MRPVRRAVILAAGRGERMGEATRDRPKPLLRVGGTTLLERQISQMARRGIESATIVTGYLAGQIRDVIGTACRDIRIDYVENRRYLETGSAQSLLLAGERLPADEPVLLTHGDIAYEDEILDRCLDAEGSITAVDAGWRRVTGDEVLVSSRNGRVEEIYKGAPRSDPERTGEFVGVSVVEGDMARDFVEMLRGRLSRSPGLNYEEPLLSDFLRQGEHVLRPSYTSTAWWINVNHPEDLAAANHHFEP